MSADLFPEDSAKRKGYPVYSGLLQYFPAALAAVAHHSFKGNEKHNPGAPLHWDRAKSGDEADALLRHLMESDYVGMAWRALALLQKHLEACGAATAPGAWNANEAAQTVTTAGIDERTCRASGDAVISSPVNGAVNRDWHVTGTNPDFVIAYDPPDWPAGVSFGPNQPKQHRRVLTDAERIAYGIGDVDPATLRGIPDSFTDSQGNRITRRHPMHAEAIRYRDEHSPEDRL